MENNANVTNLPDVQAIIVVPCYNEAHRFRKQTFRDFLAASRSIGFIFVDDGTKDATLAVLEEVRSGYVNRVRVLHCGSPNNSCWPALLQFSSPQLE